MKLFFDTETTGLANFKLAPHHQDNPRLVQLAALLVSDAGDEIVSLNAIIRPDGFEIPKESSDIHGITTEIANKKGILLRHALEIFTGISSYCDTLVGHNIAYDKFILGGELSRVNRTTTILCDKKSYCTMLESTKILKIPSPRVGYKWPKLQEAYKFFFNEEFEGAHDAMADIRATKRVYEELSLRNKIA